MTDNPRFNAPSTDTPEGGLVLDLRRATLEAGTKSVDVIDRTGRVLFEVLPDDRGLFDHYARLDLQPDYGAQVAAFLIEKPAMVHGWHTADRTKVIHRSDIYPKPDMPTLKSVLGDDAPDFTPELGRGWPLNPVAPLIQKVIKDGRRLDRLGLMRLRADMLKSSGMSNTDAPTHSATATWSMPWDHPAVSYYVKPELLIWGDRGTDGRRTMAVVIEMLNRAKDAITFYAAVAGCEHTYEGRSGGNCYHINVCSTCGHRYDIDSGD